MYLCLCYLFFFNDTATTEIYTLSLHDALPIYEVKVETIPAKFGNPQPATVTVRVNPSTETPNVDFTLEGQPSGLLVKVDRKSTRLNSSHANISYAVFCLKKKKIIHILLHFSRM